MPSQFELELRLLNGDLTFKQRKEIRTEIFNKFVKGNKLVNCTACNGSGYYDNNGSPKCGACDGTGKVREK